MVEQKQKNNAKIVSKERNETIVVEGWAQLTGRMDGYEVTAFCFITATLESADRFFFVF